MEAVKKNIVHWDQSRTEQLGPSREKDAGWREEEKVNASLRRCCAKQPGLTREWKIIIFDDTYIVRADGPVAEFPSPKDADR